MCQSQVPVEKYPARPINECEIDTDCTTNGAHKCCGTDTSGIRKCVLPANPMNPVVGQVDLDPNQSDLDLSQSNLGLGQSDLDLSQFDLNLSQSNVGLGQSRLDLSLIPPGM